MMENDNACTAGHVPSAQSRWGEGLSLSRRASRYAVFRLLQQLQHGTLAVRTADGQRHEFAGRTDAAPRIELTVRTDEAFRRLVSGGDLGFAESYVDGEWDTSDLPGLLALAQRNRDALDSGLRSGVIRRLLDRLYHRLRSNSRWGSRRNIAFHYDLGNAFYARWLDEGMTYSSALFEHRGQTLAQAQEAKYRRIGDLTNLRPHQDILEIGCGWGGFMEHAVTRMGCTVEGVTLSREQLAFANTRMADAGLGGRARASLTDYRDTRGSYDAVVSIEMLEAVGEAHWPHYFHTLFQRLKPGGAAVVQVITIAEERFDFYRRNTDFIQRHIFPGGMLPSPSVLMQQARGAGLVPDHQETFGPSYARTLAEWRTHFLSAWPQVASLGFDERFRRLWHYYLCYCEAGFRAGDIDVGIYRFRRPG